MLKFIAIIAFCINGECAFWASNSQPIYSEQECQQVVAIKTMQLEQDGIPSIGACIPLLYKDKEA
jgi:hypothetical protein